MVRVGFWRAIDTHAAPSVTKGENGATQFRSRSFGCATRVRMAKMEILIQDKHACLSLPF